MLGKTLGVPLFQEQAMKVAIVCAGFTPSEADQLRRSMATFKVTGGVSHFRDKLIAGMVARGYTRDFAARTFSQIEGFGSYGFPESHAASFALIAYASSWMKCHHPDVFCAALLNAQPMGFYAPAQIVRDARRHGVMVRPVCINRSRWDCTLEAVPGSDRLAVRLGLRMAKGLANTDGAEIVAARGEQDYSSVEDVWRRARVAPRRWSGWRMPTPITAWAWTGAQRCGRSGDCATGRCRCSPLPTAIGCNRNWSEPTVALPPMTRGREVVEDYASTGLTLRPHPVSFLRGELRAQGMMTCGELAGTRDGRRVTVPGIVLVRQKPGSAKGVLFVTIEDETGIANLIIWPSVFERQRRLILSAGMIACHGRVQREGDVVHVIAQTLTDLSALLRSVGRRNEIFPIRPGRGDQVTHGGGHDPRESLGRKPRDILVPDLRLGSGIKVPTRDFR